MMKRSGKRSYLCVSLFLLFCSDSDDDVPLSSLRAKTKIYNDQVKTEKIKTEASVDGAEKKKRRQESDSDDDVPISGFVRRKNMKIETKVKTEKLPHDLCGVTVKSTPRKMKKRVIKIKIRQQECTEKLYETLKGRLAQELLCRWWYALEWPPATKALKSKLHGVQELDGYPGAFIRVKGDDLGSIIDTRPAARKPSFLHFFAMSSEKLQKLLLQAYDKQMAVLSEHEGSDTPLLKELQKARASAARINANKADRSVQKLLKSFAELEREIKEVEALAFKEENTPCDEGEEDNDDDTADE